ncbi:MAG: PEP/pyruvate-binding domain-containing protein [Synergistaceae bacterium]|nr:PEP/pyruvate-binding domain-containing protein [Synergistaceae bacterium]
MGTPILDYETFNAEEYFRRNNAIVGAGRCGGKAKGLAYAKCALEGTPLDGSIGFAGLTIVLSTELFDECAARSGIYGPLDEEDWDRARDAVYESLFPPPVKFELDRVLDRFDELGAPPLAIRSSSLLEDSLSLAFAGKYQTCFSHNTGSRADRYDALERAVRTVFASVFNPSARAYRAKHGMLDAHESMAVVIQSVAGRRHDCYYYPELAGTLFSRVFRRPNPRIKKEDGLMRVCFGLGTRSVDRCAARTFYLTNPSLRPEGSLPSMIAEASQEYFDYIDTRHGAFLTGALSMFTRFLQKEHRNFGAYVQYYGDDFLYSAMADPEITTRPLFSFPELHIRERALFDASRTLLAHLENTAGFPVDIEFSYETEPEKKLSVLQMRPLTSYEEMNRVEIPEVPGGNIIFKGDRMVSNGVLENVTHLVYVDPGLYKSAWDPSKAARAVGEANKLLAGKKYILAGPGRWGSRNPALGVPVRYDEICNCGVLVEISVPDLNFSPELSFGTHFFLDMDSDGILYLPVFGRQGGNRYNTEWLDAAPFSAGSHPALRIYEGNFSAYLDGEIESGIITMGTAD